MNRKAACTLLFVPALLFCTAGACGAKSKAAVRGAISLFEHDAHNGAALRVPRVGNVTVSDAFRSGVRAQMSELRSVWADSMTDENIKKATDAACKAKDAYVAFTANTLEGYSSYFLGRAGVSTPVALVVREAQKLVDDDQSGQAVRLAASEYTCRWASAD